MLVHNNRDPSHGGWPLIKFWLLTATGLGWLGEREGGREGGRLGKRACLPVGRELVQGGVDV